MATMITTLTQATTKNTSLRTTVPAGVVKQLQLKRGDKLDWEFDKEGGRWIAVVRPIVVRSKHESIN